MRNFVGTAVIVLIVSFLIVPTLLPRGKKDTLPQIATVQDFHLSSTTGSDFDSTVLSGKVWLGNFFFTSCKGVCPRIMGELVVVRDHFSAQSDVEIVSISIDPENDTLSRLRDYKQNIAQAGESWHFLRGEKGYVTALSEKGFKLAASPDDVNGHSRRIVLVDRKGYVRQYYNGLQEGVAAQIILDVESLL